VMTTMAAIMGTLPITLGPGAGAELRQPLGIVVVSGLLTSQLLTLFITPVIYLSLEDARRGVLGAFGRFRSVPPRIEPAGGVAHRFCAAGGPGGNPGRPKRSRVGCGQKRSRLIVSGPGIPAGRCRGRWASPRWSLADG
jgi:hypothetical protein